MMYTGKPYFWGHICKSKDIAFGFTVVMCLGSANCSRPVTSVYLHRLNNNKLI